MRTFHHLFALAVLGLSIFARAAVVPQAASTGLTNTSDADEDRNPAVMAGAVTAAPTDTPVLIGDSFKVKPKTTKAKTTKAKTTKAKATSTKAAATAKPTKTTSTKKVATSTKTKAPTGTSSHAPKLATSEVSKASTTKAPKTTKSQVATASKSKAPKATGSAKPKASHSVQPKASHSAKSAASHSAKSTAIHSVNPKASNSAHSAKPKASKTASAKSSAKSSAQPSASACPYKPKGGKRDYNATMHQFAVRNGCDGTFDGGAGNQGTYDTTKTLGKSGQANVYDIEHWNGAAPSPPLVIKVLKTQKWTSSSFNDEVRNLKACKRFKAGPGTAGGKAEAGLVMLRGVGQTVLQGSSEWKAAKTKDQLNALLDIVAPQVAKMCIQWMNDYGRMHTDLNPGNIMVSGSGADMKVTDLIDLGSMLEKLGKGVTGSKGPAAAKAFQAWTTDEALLEADIRKVFLNKNKLLG